MNLTDAATTEAGNVAYEAYRARSAFLARLWDLTPDDDERERLAFGLSLLLRARSGEVFGDPSIHSAIDSRLVSW